MHQSALVPVESFLYILQEGQSASDEKTLKRLATLIVTILGLISEILKLSHNCIYLDKITIKTDCKIGAGRGSQHLFTSKKMLRVSWTRTSPQMV